MIHSTAKQLIIRENCLNLNHIIVPGALVLPEDRVTVQWNMNYDQEPLGFARAFEREDEAIWAEIDWISDQWKAFYDADGTFSSDWFEFSAYATDVKLDADDDGNFLVEYGVIRAVNIYPLPYLPKKVFTNAQIPKDED